jgi:hypothetical protein
VQVGEKVTAVVNPAEGKGGLKGALASMVKPQGWELSLSSFAVEYSKRNVPASEYADLPGGEAIAEFESYEVWHYISGLTATHNGKDWSGRVTVNHPLRAGGAMFYQSSYVLTGSVIVTFDGKEAEYPVEPGTFYQVGTDGALHAISAESLDPGGSEVMHHPDPIGGTFPVKVGTLYERGKEAGKVAIGLFELMETDGTPIRWMLLKPDKALQLTVPGHTVSIRISEKTNSASIFQYKRDPGILLVFLAWIIMILAMSLAAYVTYVRVEMFWGEDGAVFTARTLGARPADAFARAVEKELQGK